MIEGRDKLPQERKAAASLGLLAVQVASAAGKIELGKHFDQRDRQVIKLLSDNFRKEADMVAAFYYDNSARKEGSDLPLGYALTLFFEDYDFEEGEQAAAYTALADHLDEFLINPHNETALEVSELYSQLASYARAQAGSTGEIVHR